MNKYGSLLALAIQDSSGRAFDNIMYVFFACAVWFMLRYYVCVRYDIDVLIYLAKDWILALGGVCIKHLGDLNLRAVVILD